MKEEKIYENERNISWRTLSFSIERWRDSWWEGSFLRAKQALEEGQDLQKVALNLKRELSPIMVEQKFSEEGIAFSRD